MTTALQRQALERQADQAAAYLPGLLVAAQRIAANIMLGAHGRRRPGMGESFWQYRTYGPDDAPAAIDWRQSAKSDAVFIKEREWTAAQTVALWCDLSPSMHFRSRKDWPTKVERAATLMLALGIVLTEGGEKILRLNAEGAPLPGATSGRIAVTQMADRLARDFDHSASAVFPDFRTPLPRYGSAVLFGDFLQPLPELSQSFARMAGHNQAVHLVQVLDPAEETLPFAGRVRFEGLENEGDLVIDRAENIHEQYADRMARHREGLRLLAASYGWSFATHRTDQPPQLTLVALHRSIGERRR